MPRGPLGGRRPGASSTLQMRIREVPVPTDDDSGVLPEPLLRSGGDEEEIISDIVSRTQADEDRLSVDRTTSFKRGLGQTTVWTINLNVSGVTPRRVVKLTDKLGRAGYEFESVVFE